MKSNLQHQDENGQSADIRYRIFQGHQHRFIQATIRVETGGIISGIGQAEKLAAELPVGFSPSITDGDEAIAGQTIAKLNGHPVNLVKAEEMILGALSKTSGIATRARQAGNEARGCFDVVCGAFKKMPPALKQSIRQAVEHGGLRTRMAPQPFIYLDKNYVRILGGVEKTMATIAPMNLPIVIQIRGENDPIEQEALQAASMGAATLMVDTGNIKDLDTVSKILHEKGLRSRVKLAFAGNLQVEDLAPLRNHDIDAIDIGYGMVDAPCLPMRFDVNPT